jgi:hypothetical protein
MFHFITCILINTLSKSKIIYCFLSLGNEGGLKNSFLHEVIDSIQEHPRNSVQQKAFHTKDNTTFVNLTLSSNVIHKQVVRPVQPLKTSSTTSTTPTTTSITTTTTLLEEKDNITFINLTLVGQVIHKPAPQTPIPPTESTTTSTSTTTTSTSTKLPTTLPVKTTTGIYTSFQVKIKCSA